MGWSALIRYATKRSTGKVVPTWNHAVAQAVGPLTVIDGRDWLSAQVSALTARHEEGRREPWAVSDAPPAFLESQLKGIVGIEIPITRIEGKWKVSQNPSGARPPRRSRRAPVIGFGR